MASVFVSYRRTDAPGQAGRLYDRLVGRFGESNVYKDLDSTKPGADFAEVIEDTVSRCDALVAVIGRSWLRAQQGRENAGWRIRATGCASRSPTRSSAESASSPVLVDGASMPSAADLPDDVKALAQRHR
jgi:hypothetical protein